MKKPKQPMYHSRRKFLRDAGMAGGAATAAVAAPTAALADSTDADTSEKPKDGYRLTKHILAYYKSAAS